MNQEKITNYKRMPKFDYVCPKCGVLRNLTSVKTRRNYPHGRNSKASVTMIHKCGNYVNKVKRGKKL